METLSRVASGWSDGSAQTSSSSSLTRWATPGRVTGSRTNPKSSEPSATRAGATSA